MIARQIDRPIPMPSDLVVKSGLNIRSMSCGLIPVAGVRNRYHYAVTFVRLGFHA